MNESDGSTLSLILEKFRGKNYDICGDVGGTNTRINFKCEDHFFRILTILSPTRKILEDELSHLLEVLVKSLGGHPQYVCFSWAFPIPDNYASDIPFFGRDIFPFAKTFPKSIVLSLNDLEAGAYGILKSVAEKTVFEYFSNNFLRQIGDQEQELFYEEIVGTKSMGIFCKGTGVGVGMLHKLRSSQEEEKGAYEVIPTEASSVTVTYPFHPKYESEVLGLMKYVTENSVLPPERDYLRGPLKYEYLAGGYGIPILYEYFSKNKEEKLTSKEIAEFASKEEENMTISASRKAMFYSDFFLVSCSRILSIMFPNIGVLFFTGDIQVKNREIFERHVKERRMMEEVFLHFGFPWMKDIVGFSQVKEKNFNLEGCSYFIHLEKQK